MLSPFANILHREAIRALSDGRSFARGHDYFARGRVVSMQRRNANLSASVRGSSDYAVRIWVKDSALAYSCTCPAAAEGAFCKHCVAVGLAWVANEAEVTPKPGGGGLPELRYALSTLSKEALCGLILQEGERDPSSLARLLARARRHGTDA